MKKYFAAAAGMFVLSGIAALPAFAQTAAGIKVTGTTTISVGGVNAGASAGVGVGANVISKAEARADQEITRRVDALNALTARVNAMVRLSSDDKSTLSSAIQGQITLMNNLQTQIAADASSSATSSLKTDIQSITKSYRIFALIIPQGAIAAAADRVETVTGLMSSLAAKLQARITDAATAGNDTTADAAALADMNAKITDANAQAQAAVAETIDLQPDNGVTSTMQANTATLKDARSKIVAAQADLKAAREDAGTIIKDLLSFKASANASTTVSASSTASASGTASGTAQ